MDNKVLFHCNESGPLLVRRKLLPKGWAVRYLNHSARLTLEQEHSEREITVLVSGTQNGVSYGVLVYFTADGALQAQRVVESDYRVVPKTAQPAGDAQAGDVGSSR